MSDSEYVGALTDQIFEHDEVAGAARAVLTMYNEQHQPIKPVQTETLSVEFCKLDVNTQIDEQKHTVRKYYMKQNKQHYRTLVKQYYNLETQRQRVAACRTASTSLKFYVSSQIFTEQSVYPIKELIKHAKKKQWMKHVTSAVHQIVRAWSLQELYKKVQHMTITTEPPKQPQSHSLAAESNKQSIGNQPNPTYEPTPDGYLDVRYAGVRYWYQVKESEKQLILDYAETIQKTLQNCDSMEQVFTWIDDVSTAIVAEANDTIHSPDFEFFQVTDEKFNYIVGQVRNELNPPGQEPGLLSEEADQCETVSRALRELVNQ